MQFNITGKHLDVSDALREHVEAILGRLENTNHAVTSAQVTLQKEKHEMRADATLHVANSGEVHGDAKHEDMYAALDKLEEKLVRQLQKLKEKAEQH